MDARTTSELNRLREEWYKLKEDGKFIQVAPGEYDYDNKSERERVKEQYRSLTETEAHEIARLLHKKLCHYSHTDQCSWYYSTVYDGLADDWTSYSHKEYLEKANRLIEAGFTLDDVKRFLECIK